MFQDGIHLTSYDHLKNKVVKYVSWLCKPNICDNGIVSHNSAKAPKLMLRQRENDDVLKRRVSLRQCSVVQGHENLHFS